MDAIEAMTVLRNRRILSVFAAVSYPRQYCNIYACINGWYFQENDWTTSGGKIQEKLTELDFCVHVML